MLARGRPSSRITGRQPEVLPFRKGHGTGRMEALYFRVSAAPNSGRARANLPIACVTHGSGTRPAFLRFPLNECFKPSRGQNPAGRGPIVSGRHRAHWAPRLKACPFSARSRRIPLIGIMSRSVLGTNIEGGYEEILKIHDRQIPCVY